MNWFDDTVRPILLRPETAGVFGSILSLRFASGDSWWSRFIGLSSGLGASIYMAPWLIESIHISSVAGVNMFTFLCGLLGMNMLSKTVDAFLAIEWVNTLKEAMKQWVNK